ncbi:MAG: amidase [Desulfobacterales bacterium]
MGGFKEYDQFDAMGLAACIRRGEISAAELGEEAIARIERIDPRLNAVVTPMFERGRHAAQQPLPDGPLAGVPFLIKDLLQAYAGVPLTSGCKAYRHHVPDYDSAMVRRYKRAGLITIGKTNTPEFGLTAITESELFGPCRNPWHTALTPGGSSGGAAAAVASGMVPLAAGGDGGGSIRIPAAYCGLFGLKPSRGRNPGGPRHGQIWQGAVQEHVLSRSVRDSAAALDATQGPDQGAPYEIRPPVRPYREEIKRPPGKLKIGFSAASPIGTPVHAEGIRAVQQTAALLEELGHHPVQTETGVDGKALANAYLTLYFGEMAADLEDIKQMLGRKAAPGDVEATTYTLALLGRAFSAGHFVTAMRCWDHAARQMGQFFRDYDLFLTPTTAQPPAAIGALQPKAVEKILLTAINTLGWGRLLKASGIVDQLAAKSLMRTPFTFLANLTGLPAMSVPLHWSAEGLPWGLHFVAPFGKEDLLFRLAAQLETARPWAAKKPPVWAGPKTRQMPGVKRQ